MTVYLCLKFFTCIAVEWEPSVDGFNFDSKGAVDYAKVKLYMAIEIKVAVEIMEALCHSMNYLSFLLNFLH